MANTCNFCGEQLSFYEGCLGYSAYKCDKCGTTYGQDTITIENEKHLEFINSLKNKQIFKLTRNMGLGLSQVQLDGLNKLIADKTRG